MEPTRAPLRVIRHGRGFTLIEVMITVGIVAILAAVALPAYFDSVRKARRADAINGISRAQQMQERFRVGSPSYGEKFNAAAATAVVNTGSVTSFTSSDGYYTIAIAQYGSSGAPAAAASATAYNLRASPITATSSQAKDKNCQCLELAASAGQISYGIGSWSSGACGWSSVNTGAAANQCWRK